MDGLNYMTKGAVGDVVWLTNRDGTVDEGVEGLNNINEVEGLDQGKFPNIGRQIVALWLD